MISKNPSSPRATAALIAMLILIVACGDDGGGTTGTDAGSTAADAGGGTAADAGTDAAPQGTGASITLSANGVPVAGIVVLLHDSNGALIDLAVTNLDGTHTFEGVAADSSASVFAGAEERLLTYFGVQPGDDLAIGDSEGAGEFSATVQFTLAAQGGASSYRVESSCYPATVDAAVLQSISIRAACVTEGNVSLLATALDTSGLPIAHAVIEDLPLSNGETKIANFPAWSAASAAASYTLSNVALAATNIGIGVGVWRGANDYLAHSLSGLPGGSEIVWALVPPPASFYDSYAVFLGYVEAINANLPGSTQLVRRHDGAVADQSYDIVELRMPRISNLSVAWPASGARPRFSIATDAPTNSLAPSAVIGEVRFGIDPSRWNLIAPPGTVEAQLPELPNGFNFRTSYPDPPASTSISIALMEGIDYDAYRNHPLDLQLSMGQNLGDTNSSVSGASLSP